jgi:hypothetical protein
LLRLVLATEAAEAAEVVVLASSTSDHLRLAALVSILEDDIFGFSEK